MRGGDGGGSTTSREMISSSSGVRTNQQPTTATSEKVCPKGKQKSALHTSGNRDMNTLLAVCRETANLPDSKRLGSHHEDRPAQQPAGIRRSGKQNQPRSGTEVKNGFRRDTHDFLKMLLLFQNCTKDKAADSCMLKVMSPIISTPNAHSDRTNLCAAVRRRLKMEEFIPTTFRMDARMEREAFFANHESKTGHPHEPAAHPVATTTQHWFDWICGWSTSSNLKNLT